LKLRFFTIVFSLLLGTIVIVSVLQTFFFENERLRLRDERIETVASNLIASGLSLDLIDNLDSTDDLIHDLLGEERVDQIINIYSLDGDVLAQNFTATQMPLKFSVNDRWQTYDVLNRTVRVLNLRHNDLIVQVGMILVPNPMGKQLFNSRFAFFSIGILILLILAAYYGSRVLFKPLIKLSDELRESSLQLDTKLGQPLSGFVIGQELTRLSKGKKNTKDEFERLVNELIQFLEKLGDYTKSFNAQTAILTHELKTPLAILKTYLDEISGASDLEEAQTLNKSALNEIANMTKLINDYLQWSILTSNPQAPSEIYAVKFYELAQNMIGSLNLAHDDRIHLERVENADPVAFAMPDHLRQLLANLLSNALNYSPVDKPVICRIGADFFEVEDSGPGISEEVRAHMGSPFNRGNLRNPTGGKGSGLGLAWVNSLCGKYNWQLTLDSNNNGTKVRVKF
jgi:signal transduction histidine kinase